MRAPRNPVIDPRPAPPEPLKHYKPPTAAQVAARAAAAKATGVMWLVKP
jgi:hypothetical protein